MQLHDINLSVKNKKTRRVGRGTGSGRGKTSGRGHKGAGQRKGVNFYIGMNGGNVPYFRKIPKRGFTNPTHKEYQVVNLFDIATRLSKAKEVTPKELKEVNLIRDEKKPVKVLAVIRDAKLKAVTVKAHKFSQKAVQMIEDAGGKVECLKP